MTRDSKIMWAGGMFSANSNSHKAEYVGSSNASGASYIIGELSSGTSNSLLSGDTTGKAPSYNAKNATDADAYVLFTTDDNGNKTRKIHLYKSKCTSNMRCTYNGNYPKLFSNNKYIWYASFDDGKFVIACDYKDFSDTDSLKVRMPNNADSTSGYIKTVNSVEYSFTQDVFDRNNGTFATNMGMFSGCTNLTSCEVPCEMRKISNNTFSGCTSLTSYTKTPEFIGEIGMNAFSDCTNLSTLLIPRYASVATGAFSGCTNATSITWDDVSVKLDNTTSDKYNMTQISNNTFKGCTRLSASTFSGNIPKSIIIIPNGIESIGDNAFSGCTSISYLKFNGVKDIGQNAFYGDNSLVAVNGSNTVSGISPSAFANCTSLREFDFSGTKEIGVSAFTNTNLSSVTTSVLTKIESYAFAGCSNLESANIKSDNEIGKWGTNIFNGCTNLSAVTISAISSSNITVSADTFSGCTNLRICNLASGVKTIGNNTFRGKTNLTSCRIGNDVTSIGEYAFQQCSGLTSITVPDNVTTINYSAFGFCSGLTSITIGSDVTSIGEYAFYYCTSLSSITINAIEAPSLGSNVFDGLPSGGKLYVPQGSTGYNVWLDKLSNWELIEQ